MKLSFVIAILLCAGISNAVNAQEGHSHRHEPAEKVGRVNFKVSCKPAAQRLFNRAVAWLHSFEYEEAEKTFTEVTANDPQCGMGYWGIAMSNYHPLWAPPTADELQKGLRAVEKAKAANAPTQREREYIAAIESFYRDSDTLDHRTRVLAYSDAMERLSRFHFLDREAGIFYALALIAKGMMANDKSYTNEKKASEILNRALAREPQHPGVTHYLIHGYDFPALAHLALPAARSYAKIAPASAHAQHMPSHIFTRMGLWPDAVQSNLAAKSAAKAYAVRNGMTGAWDEQIHAMDYLAYAYLQSGQDKQAWGVLNELNKIQRVDPPNFKVAYAFTAIPARYALERRQWSEAARLMLPRESEGVFPAVVSLKDFPWKSFRWAEAHIHFARAVGAARSGDAASARDDVKKLASIQEELGVVKSGYDWAKQVDILRKVASAWLSFAEGNREESVKLMRAAAELDDATEKHPVTPGAILPAREQLGELLFELKEPAAALLEFETSLRSTPNRFNGLYGAARAARTASDDAKAKTYYKRLLDITRGFDTNRPEVAEAEAFLGVRNVKMVKSHQR